jgi:phosphoribosylanthranilate isomerase
MVLVKICGITNLDDALGAVDAGADALGFNFWRPGKRYISPEGAAQIIEGLPSAIMKAGVFVDENAAEVRRIASDLGLNAIQMHGRETPEYAERLRATQGAYGQTAVQLWKAFRIDDSFRAGNIASRLAAYNVDAFLLDGAGPAPGGNAAAFDWSLAREAAGCGREILAGGLHPGNVAQAIGAVRPWAVDVASGVESAPGRKDAALMRRFVQAARMA